MATNKNQHFVPRCYLKAFTHNTENKAINVYNVDRKKWIPLAPVKNQCSKDYFYGKDDRLERAIQSVEGAYASTLRDILNSPRKLKDGHKLVLKRFWLLQHLRTEASSRRAVEMSNGMVDVAGVQGEEFNLGIKEAVIMAMKVYAECMDVIDDLKLCLVFNKTKLPFITSDDPAVLTNRWHLYDARTKFGSFGLRTSGNLLFLPLTPKLMCVAYDGDVYSIPHKNGWTRISHISDVKAFNQHQFLNCRANVFFKNEEAHSFIDLSFSEVSGNRVSEKHRINYAVFDYKEGEHSCYKVVDPKSEEDRGDAIIHSETIHYRPTSWPKIIRYRNKGAVYSNGTGIGYLRKTHVLPEYDGFFKEDVKVRR